MTPDMVEVVPTGGGYLCRAVFAGPVFAARNKLGAVANISASAAKFVMGSHVNAGKIGPTPTTSFPLIHIAAKVA
jgi:hypothetical protein